MNERPAPPKAPADILVAEDSPTQAEALRYMLEQAGYRVTLARNGRQAHVMQQTFRESDILARIGGDEFTVLYIDCNPATTNLVVSHLKDNLDRINAETINRSTLSLSVGVAHVNPNNQATISELVEQADDEMYTEKLEKHERGG
jgi:diguanylate cyclase (GGDEF)-like protein